MRVNKMSIVKTSMIDEMKNKNLTIIGGIIYVRYDGKAIACANGINKKGIGFLPLNKCYIFDVKNCSNVYLEEILTNIFEDSLYYEEKKLELDIYRKNEIQKCINKDIRNKVIDKNKYLGINYCKSDKTDKFTVTDFQRDGKAWIGRGKNKWYFTKENIDDFIKKIKELLYIEE